VGELSSEVQVTGAEAEAALKAGVEALFATARVAEPHERAAYLQPNPQGVPHVYVAFSNGFKKAERTLSETYDTFYDDLEGMVASMINAVADEFPDHAIQEMVWRIEPEYEWTEAYAGNLEYGLPASPAHHSTYCRLAALSRS
jgi:hypothetical protein